MTSPSKRKGDRAELEVQGILREQLGVNARRALGAGRLDDVGDIHGVPDTVIQVCDYKDIARAVREKPLECEQQRQRAWRNGHPSDPVFGATFIRLRGGDYRVVMTVEQYTAMWRETR